jgi:hypothetical protein
MAPWGEGVPVELDEYIEKTVEKVRAGLTASGAGGDAGQIITVDIEAGTRLEGDKILADELPRQRLVGKVKCRVHLDIPAAEKG